MAPLAPSVGGEAGEETHLSHQRFAMLKFARFFAAAVFAVAACGVVGAAEDKPKPKYTEGSCCDKAEKKGEKCAHKCCQDAEKDGKVCQKCNKPKDDKK